MATQTLDPAMAKILGQKYWNHFAIQLGHWNAMRVIIMDDKVFQQMAIPVKIELAREMCKFLGEDVMFARDADNVQVWILGPKKVMRPDITVVGNIPIWDPRRKHVPPPEIKIPRPPNAYILYRKDKHNEVKAENPSLHNNEISVITGAMWKSETPEVRAKYHQKSLDIKAHLMALHPNYRYSPRKSSEIRRRAPRRQTEPFQHNAHQSPKVNNEKAGLTPTSEITRHIPGAQQFLPPVMAPGWTPYHLLPGNNSPAVPTPVEEEADEYEAEDDEEELEDEQGSVQQTLTQQAPADDDMTMNGAQDFNAIIQNWDIEADLAVLLGDI
ncbi:mat a-1 [Staphylotrichum tortipilum]|uniref:Mat a-1 n=1 Tax=Staphylotrichum tortipilum TaxID=2831512 RepID=A0AAN6RW52_9PEZI|nr:mat a-1 [Staphylotrichum longicolle]